nr:hypothetical protein FBMMDGCC_00086 [Klebsiella pneumoniae subsp. pneumoniae]
MLWKRRKICAGTTDYAVTLNDSINGIYLSRSSLDAAFDDDGRQINPLIEVRLENGICGHSVLCNTDFDDKLACLNLIRRLNEFIPRLDEFRA